ncbi:DUF4157 domain-containing protein [Schlegelella sp. S2-27]|uniref:DUF4157 domain-containing protein n=1 Tax=Caldimonas mangrovi TaxID=2944811 RepID=A0ABT0YRK7_9BURK|nr:DUF4157 domain-containing protein [Caldimonas mangrovi]MCM5680478.1 DUF4157 domain-containing protein [Caldimonas mangrovi]
MRRPPAHRQRSADRPLPAHAKHVGDAQRNTAQDAAGGMRGGHRTVVPPADGAPLDPAVRADMEARFGTGFDSVRVHHGPEANALAEALGAKAFAQGEDIVFSADRYAPASPQGRRLLAHELAHVVQQRRGRTAPRQHDDAAHERAADRAAGAVAAGAAAVPVEGAAAVGVAREPEDDEKRKKGGKQGGKGSKTRRTDTLVSDRKLPDADAVRRKHTLEVFGERAHDPDQKAELAEERTTRRTGRSETARHADRLKDVDEHHGLPKFLGGRRVQRYIRLTKELHYLYHEELYLLLEQELKRRGALARDAKRGARRSYGRLFSRLPAADQKAVLTRIVQHAREFDQRYATTEYPDKRQRLAAAVQRGIREAAADKAAAANKGGGKAPPPKATAAAQPAVKTPAPGTSSSPRTPAAKAAASAKPSAGKAPAGAKTGKPATAAPPARLASPPAAKVPAGPAATGPAATAPAKVATPAVAPPAARPVPSFTPKVQMRYPSFRTFGRSFGSGLAGAALAVGGAWLQDKVWTYLYEKDMEKIQPQLEAKLNDLSDFVYLSAMTAPGGSLYANVTVQTTAHTYKDPEVTGWVHSDVYIGTSLKSVAVSPVNLNVSSDHHEWGFAMNENTTTTTFSLPLQDIPFEDLVAFARAKNISLDTLRAYAEAQNREAGQASDGGRGAHMRALWSQRLKELE